MKTFAHPSDRLIVALDTPSLRDAEALADRLEDDRERSVARRHLEQVVGALALHPERHALAGGGIQAEAVPELHGSSILDLTVDTRDDTQAELMFSNLSPIGEALFQRPASVHRAAGPSCLTGSRPAAFTTGLKAGALAAILVAALEAVRTVRSPRLGGTLWSAVMPE